MTYNVFGGTYSATIIRPNGTTKITSTMINYFLTGPSVHIILNLALSVRCYVTVVPKCDFKILTLTGFA